MNNCVVGLNATDLGLLGFSTAVVVLFINLLPRLSLKSLLSSLTFLGLGSGVSNISKFFCMCSSIVTAFLKLPGSALFAVVFLTQVSIGVGGLVR